MANCLLHCQPWHSSNKEEGRIQSLVQIWIFINLLLLVQSSISAATCRTMHGKSRYEKYDRCSKPVCEIENGRKPISLSLYQYLVSPTKSTWRWRRRAGSSTSTAAATNHSFFPPSGWVSVLHCNALVSAATRVTSDLMCNIGLNVCFPQLRKSTGNTYSEAHYKCR